MAAADEERLDPHAVEGRLRHAGRGRSHDDHLPREGTGDAGVGPVKANIDRVADKVKGLLRSEN